MAVWRRIALPLGCCLSLWLWLGSTPSDSASEDQSRSEELVAVPVEDGLATFDLPRIGEHDQCLILISSLSQQSGPFPVEITTQPVTDPRPLAPIDSRARASRPNRLSERREQLQKARRDIEQTSLEKLPSPLRGEGLGVRGNPPDTPSPSPPTERTFWLMVRGDDTSDAKNYQAVHGRLAAVGQHCAVYIDRDDEAERSPKSLVQEAVATFDRDVYPTAQRTLGRHRDVDGDGRFTILFTHWLGFLSGGTVSIGGFVRGSDFYPHLQPPLGNHCDMMYLNSNLDPGPHLRTLIAHEYTHAITFSEHVFGRYLPDSTRQEEESWLDEAIAHIAENQHGYSWSNLDYRISGFLNAPERYRLVVEDYYAANLWRGHGNRGSTYLFLRWCVDQFGEELLRDLVQTNLCGVTNVETATGQSFADLYRAWSAAIFVSQSGLETRREETVRFLKLRSSLGGRLLAGPRYEYLDLGGGSTQFALVGTSTKYLIAHSLLGAGTRVRVVADPDAELQVSVRPLPKAMARLEMKATLGDPAAASGEVLPFRVQLTEHNGIAVTLEHVQWEAIAPGSNQEGQRGYVSRLLSAGDIESMSGSGTVPACGTLTLPNLPVESHALNTPSLVLKASGRDATGHAVTAWCTLDREPSSPNRQIVAQRH